MIQIKLMINEELNQIKKIYSAEIPPNTFCHAMIDGKNILGFCLWSTKNDEICIKDFHSSQNLPEISEIFDGLFRTTLNYANLKGYNKATFSNKIPAKLLETYEILENKIENIEEFFEINKKCEK